MNRYKKQKKQYETDQHFHKSSDKLYRKSLHGKVIEKIEYESPCNIFTQDLDESKKETFFIKLNIKIK